MCVFLYMCECTKHTRKYTVPVEQKQMENELGVIGFRWLTYGIKPKTVVPF